MCVHCHHLNETGIDIYPGMNGLKIVTGLGQSTISVSSRNFVIQKLNSCHANHKICNQVGSAGTYLPTRIIDVGEADDVYVRLLDSVRSDRCGLYTALSHQWGSAMVMKLTNETMADMKNGIEMGNLPRTFQHAIRMTRDLKIRYLWIDSLCIIQDSPDDWAEEASKMQDVYRNAFCTLAATGGTDSNSGFRFLRDPRTIEPFVVTASWEHRGDSVCIATNEYLQRILVPGSYYCMDFDFWRDQVEEASLNRRAWVMQERILSARTVHFSGQQVLWQCREQESCETFPDGVPGWSSPRTALWSIFLNTTGFRLALDKLRGLENQSLRESGMVEIHASWDKLVKAYSTCGLTMEEDKFVAIFSLVKEMKLVTGDEWLAGFWKSQLPNALCWAVEWDSPYLLGMIERGEPLPASRPRNWRAPSWSWASTNLPIFFSPVKELYRHHSQVAEVKEVDVSTLKTGGVTRAFLRIRGPLYTGTISPSQASVVGCKGTIDFKFGPKLLVRANICLDDHMDVRAEHLEQLHFAPIAQSCSNNGVTHIEGLLLKPTGFFRGIFSRCGKFTISDKLPYSELLRGAVNEDWVQYEEYDGTSHGYTICIL